MLRVNERIAIPMAEIELRFARSGGPGGQHVNKTESQVQARWNPAASTAISEEDRALLLAKLPLTKDGDLIVTASSERSQLRNREDALARLADRIRAALHRPKKRKKTKPSKGAQQRRIEAKKARAKTKSNRRWRPD